MNKKIPLILKYLTFLLNTNELLNPLNFMLQMLTFLIILIAAVISFALQAAVSSFFDIAESQNTILPADVSDTVKNNEVVNENCSKQQILIFPNQPNQQLGELKVERG
jgi:hypothetical protein